MADDLTVSVEEQQTTVLEGTDATFLVSLKNSEDEASAGSAPVVVSYALGGDIDEHDYQDDVSGTLTIPAGATMATLTVATVRDDLLEGDEDLTITLEDAETAAGSATLSTEDRSGSA